MSWEFFGVLLPHIASVVYEVIVFGAVLLGKGRLNFSEQEASEIADIARNDLRSSKEAIASYTRHFHFDELVRKFFWQGALLILLNLCSMLGVYFEEVFGKIQDRPSVWTRPASSVLLVVALGGVSLLFWHRNKSSFNFRSQVRSALLISHLTTLVAVAVTAYGSAVIWKMSHP